MRARILLTVFAFALTACQGGQVSPRGIQVQPGAASTAGGVSTPGRSASLADRQERAASPAAQTLYVATQSNIDVYTLGATQPRIVIGGLAGLTQLAIDSAGKRYASNFGTPLKSYTDGSLAEFMRGHDRATLVRAAGIPASGVAVDAAGDVFASAYYQNTVSGYSPGSSLPFVQLRSGIDGPGLLHVHRNDLFVGEAGTARILRHHLASSSVDLTLQLKAPGSLPQGALTYGGPFAVADDGTVYAGGAVIASDVGFEEFVDVFAPGRRNPRASVVVSTGRDAQNPPYVAAARDEVYVSVVDRNSAIEYEVGSGDPRRIRTLTAQLSQPGPIAVDAARRVYVANSNGFVIVYDSRGTAPVQTIAPPAPGGSFVADLAVGF